MFRLFYSHTEVALLNVVKLGVVAADFATYVIYTCKMYYNTPISTYLMNESNKLECWKCFAGANTLDYWAHS